MTANYFPTVKKIVITMILATVAVGLRAQTAAEAQSLFARGEYAEALPALLEEAKAKPRNAAAQHMAGIALLRTGRHAEARRFLAKGTNDSKIGLAEIAFLEYDFDGADEHLDAYEKGLKRGRRKAAEPSAEAEALRERIERGRNMMERVEQLTVIDSIAVCRDDFFRIYRLSKAAGRLVGAEALFAGSGAVEGLPAYVTENGDIAIWSAPDDNENYTLRQTIRLDDGSWDDARPLGDALGEGGDAAYPFLMSDGVTLYFANDGENSLGGYDIFMTRNNGEEYLQPQNIGMPYNSPYDDYMLAIDETRGVGYWATDRNQIPGKVTIYTYLPSDTRVNCSPDDPDIADRAFIRSIKATQEPGKDYSAYLKAPAQSGMAKAESEFSMSMGNGKVYTSLSDFKNPQAREAMEQYLDRRAELVRMEQRLAALRKSYADGNHSASSDILELERRTLAARSMLTRLRNTVIRTETR